MKKRKMKRIIAALYYITARMLFAISAIAIVWLVLILASDMNNIIAIAMLGGTFAVAAVAFKCSRRILRFLYRKGYLRRSQIF